MNNGEEKNGVNHVIEEYPIKHMLLLSIVRQSIRTEKDNGHIKLPIRIFQSVIQVCLSILLYVYHKFKMLVTPEDLVGLLALIAGERNYQITNSQRLKGGFLTGIGATVGGVCGGPVGLVVGGLVGGSLAAWKGKSTIVPLDQYLMDMDKEQRQAIFAYMNYLIEDSHVQNFVALNAKVATDPDLKRRFLDVLLCYLKVELKLNVIE